MVKGLVVLAVLLAAASNVAAQSSSSDSQENRTSAGQSRFSPPEYTSRPAISWPGRSNREALVYLLVEISAEGIPEHAEVAEGGFYEERFVSAALDGVKTYRFRPAMIDGEPIATKVIIPFVFYMSAADGSRLGAAISDPFRSEVRKVQKLFEQGDYAGADVYADQMVREKIKYGYEYAALKALLANTHLAVGHDLEALRAAEDATRQTRSSFRQFTLHQSIPPNSPANYLLPQETVLPLLDLRMRLSAKHGRLLESLLAYYELAGLQELAPDDPLVALANRITAKLEGNDPLAIEVQVKGRFWRHLLFRRNVSLNNVHGIVDSLALNCGVHHQDLQYIPGESWRVPNGWDNCSLEVLTEPDTSFQFMQFND